MARQGVDTLQRTGTLDHPGQFTSRVGRHFTGERSTRREVEAFCRRARLSEGNTVDVASRHEFSGADADAMIALTDVSVTPAKDPCAAIVQAGDWQSSSGGPCCVPLDEISFRFRTRTDEVNRSSERLLDLVHGYSPCFIDDIAVSHQVVNARNDPSPSAGPFLKKLAAGFILRKALDSSGESSDVLVIRAGNKFEREITGGGGMLTRDWENPAQFLP
ncbi:hypothetical protein FPV67DRAFT_1449353 [Lyophyllum atratum]|nr:hypothetical protein FPV67DRAFT_1449353 [Lyophyllum atratum]